MVAFMYKMMFFKVRLRTIVGVQCSNNSILLRQSASHYCKVKKKKKQQHIFIFTYLNLIKMNIFVVLAMGAPYSHKIIDDDVSWSKNHAGEATLTSGVFYL